MTYVSARIRLLLIGIAGYVLLVLPALLNGSPIYWPDSIAYLHGGSTALTVATGFETKYAYLEKAHPTPVAEETPAHAEAEALAQKLPQTQPEGPDYRVSAARSPYYAVFLVSASSMAGVQGPVYVQALLVLLAFGFLVRAAFPDSPLKPALLMLIVVPLTTAGIFAAILLPDVLAPLGLLSLAVLFVFWRRLAAVDRVFWYGLMVISALSHTTHLAMIVFLLPFAIMTARWIADQPALQPAALTVSVLILGILGNMVFVQLVERYYGYKPQSFPMIAASIIVDGPGRAFLEATCPENGYVYCDHLETRATEVDQYLWSDNPVLGVYSRVNRSTKDKMSAQQWSFLIDTLRHDFPGQFQASLSRMFRQVTNNSLGQFFYSDAIKDQLRNLPASDWVEIEQSALFNDRFPLALISRVSQWIGWIALAGVLILLIRRNLQTEIAAKFSMEANTRRALTALTLLVVLGLLINAGLTGAASQPQGRYSARVFLLFPVLLTLWVSLGRNGHPKPTPRHRP